MSERVEDNDDIGTIEWFKREFITINPVLGTNGNDVNSSYFYAERAIGDTLTDGSLLTWEMLIKRYRDYYNYMLSLQAGKYTRKENVIQTIEDYCYNKLYKSDYGKMQENSCDNYLFGI